MLLTCIMVVSTTVFTPHQEMFTRQIKFAVKFATKVMPLRHG